MAIKQIEDVLVHALKDLLSAEKQFKQALPKMADAAEDQELADAFSRHREETVMHITRLEKCFELMGRAPRSEKCEAADGLTQEGADVIEEDGEAPAKDVMLIAAGRKVEAYEIVSYEDAAELAEQLEKSDVADLLQENLADERAAASKLQKISKRLSAGARGVAA